MRSADFDWEKVFQEEFDRSLEKESQEFPRDTWFRAGRGTGEDETWWRGHGGGLARSFGDWFDQSGAAVWVTPDGVPAIELGMTPMFGDVPVRMYIDLILVLGTALVVVDLKSGSTVPRTLRQLGLYASGVEKMYGFRPAYGSFFMCRGTGKKDDEEKVFFQPPVPLDAEQYSIRYFTEQFGMFDHGVNEGVFVANPGEQCRRCGVNWACPSAGGSEAGRY